MAFRECNIWVCELLYPKIVQPLCFSDELPLIGHNYILVREGISVCVCFSWWQPIGLSAQCFTLKRHISWKRIYSVSLPRLELFRAKKESIQSCFVTMICCDLDNFLIQIFFKPFAVLVSLVSGYENGWK